jgi:hypothetical protein
MLTRIAITLLAIPLAMLLIVCVVAGMLVAIFCDDEECA